KLPCGGASSYCSLPRGRNRRKGPVVFEPVPGCQHETGSAVLPKLPKLFLLQHTKGLRGKVRPIDVGRVENVAQFVAAEAVEVGVDSIEFGTKVRSTHFVPCEGRAIVAEVFCPRPHI